MEWMTGIEPALSAWEVPGPVTVNVLSRSNWASKRLPGTGVDRGLGPEEGPELMVVRLNTKGSNTRLTSMGCYLSSTVWGNLTGEEASGRPSTVQGLPRSWMSRPGRR